MKASIKIASCVDEAVPTILRQVVKRLGVAVSTNATAYCRITYSSVKAQFAGMHKSLLSHRREDK